MNSSCSLSSHKNCIHARCHCCALLPTLQPTGIESRHSTAPEPGCGQAFL
ncbi:MAG: hypothetical protein PHS35_04545 [Dehalococcoidales bacterium]|nr:hypothetical protein [Dehalococcoidales bacterium]